MADIKKDIRAMADAIKKDLKVAEATAGSAAVLADENVYEKTLESSGLTPEIVKKVQTHNSKFVPAATLAVGEVAQEAMKKDKSLNEVAFDQPMGKDKLTITHTREVEGPEGEEPKYGETFVNYRVQALESKTSLNAVRKHLRESAREAFKK